MRLSEAIRLGAMLRPQGFGSLERHGKTCAFGAAYEAIGIAVDNERETAVPIEWKWAYLRAKQPTCPTCGRGRFSFAELIAGCLNDKHGWTRERIADWVATIEPHDEQQAVAPTEPCEAVAAIAAPGEGP